MDLKMKTQEQKQLEKMIFVQTTPVQHMKQQLQQKEAPIQIEKPRY